MGPDIYGSQVTCCSSIHMWCHVWGKKKDSWFWNWALRHRWIPWQRVAVCCSVLQRVAACCSVLQNHECRLWLVHWYVTWLKRVMSRMGALGRIWVCWTECSLRWVNCAYTYEQHHTPPQHTATASTQTCNILQQCRRSRVHVHPHSIHGRLAEKLSKVNVILRLHSTYSSALWGGYDE